MSDPIQPPSAPQVPPAYQAPSAAPGYPAPPVGAPPVPPAYQAPPGAYGVPVGGYQAPTAGGYAVPEAKAPRSPALGLAALIAAVIAAVVTPIVAGITAYQIGFAVPEAFSNGNVPAAGSLAILSPVREQVLWAEISFWAGTVLGLFAIIAGIIAIAKRRGRGQGIAAVVVAVIAPIIYFVVLGILLGLGVSAGAITTLGGV